MKHQQNSQTLDVQRLIQVTTGDQHMNYIYIWSLLPCTERGKVTQWPADSCGYPGPTPMKLLYRMPPIAPTIVVFQN